MNAKVPHAGAGNGRDHRLDLLILGAPGTGKGTQAEVLTRTFSLVHIATGDLFREHLKRQSDLGTLAKSFMDRGQLVPDDVTANMVRERLQQPDTAGGFLLDGFPRTLPQAEALAQLMGELGRGIRGVIHIHLYDAEIIRRVSARVICRNCQTPYNLDFNPPPDPTRCEKCGGPLYQRDDDRPETVRARLEVYHRQTAPVVAYYRTTGLMKEIDAIIGRDQVSVQAIAFVRALAA